jgi:rubrerythrin
MSKHDLINGLNDVANYMERASMANKMKNVELKVRLEEMAADEARHARELRRLAKGM